MWRQRLFFLAPWGRGRGPTRKCWEGEGEQVPQLKHLLPLILPSFAWAPPSPRWGEGKHGDFDSSKDDHALAAERNKEEHQHLKKDCHKRKHGQCLRDVAQAASIRS